jgi:hypothetical protein
MCYVVPDGSVFTLSRNPISNINETDPLAVSFSLEQNYPNPFNPSTKITWHSTVSANQSIKVYDVLGNEIAILVDEFRVSGTYEVEFHPGDLPSGIYFYRLQAGDFIQTKKMILIK